MPPTTTEDLIADIAIDARVKIGIQKTKPLRANTASKLIQAQLGHGRKPLGSMSFETRIIAKARIHRALWIFEFKKPPSFLTNSTKLLEKRFGFVLLVGWKQWIAVAYSGLNWSERAAHNYLTPLDYPSMRSLASTVASAYERLNLRNLSISDTVVQSQSLEAVDLDGVMPMISSGRQVVRSTRVRDKNLCSWSMGLATGRLSQPRGRDSIDKFCSFCVSTFRILDGLSGPQPAGFLDSFATPIKLADLPSTVHPTGALFHLHALDDALATGALTLSRPTSSGVRRDLSCGAASRLVRRLAGAMEIVYDASKDASQIRHPHFGHIGKLRANAQSFSVGGSAQKLRLKDTVGEEQSLSAWIRAEGAMHLVFSDIRYAYADNQMFRDDGIFAQIPTLRAILKPDPGLQPTTSEKGLSGELLSSSTKFPPNSVFHRIESHTSSGDNLLACDDLGDEWADFIGVKTTGGRPRLTFYHAKFGKSLVSATAFHELVGQAQKNLGRILATRTELQGKLSSWSSVFKLDKIITNIPRVRRPLGGTADHVVDAILKSLEHPALHVRVVLVTPALRYAALCSELDAVPSSTSPQSSAEKAVAREFT